MALDLLEVILLLSRHNNNFVILFYIMLVLLFFTELNIQIQLIVIFQSDMFVPYDLVLTDFGLNFLYILHASLASVRIILLTDFFSHAMLLLKIIFRVVLLVY